MQKNRYLHIPETITVHLGKPDVEAPNKTVPFVDYIKNAASSEAYPIWPENELRAIICAITTFVLNRIYTEWYRSRGYNFDITNDTQYDPAFICGRSIFKNISNIVDEACNCYMTRQGSIVPCLTHCCNDSTGKCNEHLQWCNIPIDENGPSLYEILKRYYGENINIVENAPLQGVTETYCGTPLMQGASGDNVIVIKQQLNRISKYYPEIPQISLEKPDFDQRTENAVRTFQKIFDLPITGVIDKATWYKIKQYYIRVDKHGKLMSQIIAHDKVLLPCSKNLATGAKGITASIQYYLTVIEYFNPDLNTVKIDGNFDSATVNAIKQFQRVYGLQVTGVADEKTMAKLKKIYQNILEGLPSGYHTKKAKPYQDHLKSTGESQSLAIPVSGLFDFQTPDDEYTFQNLSGLSQNDVVGPELWRFIPQQYNIFIGASDN